MSYTVKGGDTISAVTSRLNCSFAQLKAANPEAFGRTKNGVWYLVAGSDLEVGPKATQGTGQSTAATSTYVVQRGETVRQVCNKLGQSFDTLKKLNPAAVRRSPKGVWYFLAGAELKVPQSFGTALANAQETAQASQTASRNIPTVASPVSLGLATTVSPVSIQPQIHPGQALDASPAPEAAIVEPLESRTSRTGIIPVMPAIESENTKSAFDARVEIARQKIAEATRQAREMPEAPEASASATEDQETASAPPNNRNDRSTESLRNPIKDLLAALDNSRSGRAAVESAPRAGYYPSQPGFSKEVLRLKAEVASDVDLGISLVDEPRRVANAAGMERATEEKAVTFGLRFKFY